MDNCKKFIADFPVNTAEFFTAITTPQLSCTFR